MIYERGVETCLPTLSLFLAPPLSFIPTASSQHSRANIQKSPRNFLCFSFCFVFYIHKDSHSGGTRGYFFFFFFLPVCEAAKRNRVWLRSWERLFEESHLLSSFLSVYVSRLVPPVLLCFSTLFVRENVKDPLWRLCCFMDFFLSGV